MSDGENKSGPPAAAKRRRRRRKPAGEGGTDAAARPAGSAGGDAGRSPGRSKRRRSGRAGGDRARGDKPAGGETAKRGEGATGSSESRRKRSRRKPSDEKTRAKSGGRSGGRSPQAPAEPSPKIREKPLYDQETPAPAEVTRTRWGDDSDAPTPDIKLAADLPPGPAKDDWDPVSASLLESDGGYEGQLSARVCNVIGVRFVPTGRMYLYDAGDGHFDKGDKVVVEGDRGQRTATVSVASSRRPPPRSLKRIVRRGSLNEQAGSGEAERIELQGHLGVAKAKAKELRLSIKVFRATFEDDRKKLGIYYSCDDKTDVRPLSRALSDALPLRVELRHTGVRDEAKLVGGIGACGQELCCTTWLPSFAPVSIKHAKDQGLALTPSKISGQCGRLKCCLVYEQENYAKMRKGLPKLGKRVITNDGFEGRVIELDVLHQRIRVSVGRGESKVYKKGEVEPMFASQPQGGSKKKSAEDRGKSQSPRTEENTAKIKEEPPNE